jgi:ribonuclease HI
MARDGLPVGRGHGAAARGRDATSNVAEYLGLIEGLEAVLDLTGGRRTAVRVFGDARVVIDQMRGAAAVNAESMRLLHRQAQMLARRLEPVDWVWRPRRENHSADQLTRRAMHQMRADHQAYQAAMQAIDLDAASRKAAARLHSLLDVVVFSSQLMGL